MKNDTPGGQVYMLVPRTALIRLIEHNVDRSQGTLFGSPASRARAQFGLQLLRQHGGNTITHFEYEEIKANENKRAEDKRKAAQDLRKSKRKARSNDNVSDRSGLSDTPDPVKRQAEPDSTKSGSASDT